MTPRTENTFTFQREVYLPFIFLSYSLEIKNKHTHEMISAITLLLHQASTEYKCTVMESGLPHSLWQPCPGAPESCWNCKPSRPCRGFHAGRCKPRPCTLLSLALCPRRSEKLPKLLPDKLKINHNFLKYYQKRHHLIWFKSKGQKK